MNLQSDVLRKIPLFRNVGTALLGKIGALSSIVAAPAGEILVRAGELPTSMTFVLEGRVALTGGAADGSSAVVEVVQPIAGISLVTALTDMPYPVAAETVIASLLLVIAAGPMRALLGQTPVLAAAMMQGIAMEFGSLIRQVVDLKLHSTPQRLGCYLLDLVDDPAARRADFRLPFDKGLLAARLGCRQENLSRAFATLRDVGVETHGARVILHDIRRLRDFAAPVPIEPGAGEVTAPARQSASVG